MSLRAFALLLAFSLAVFSVLVALGWQSRVPGPAPRSESKTAGNTVARFATDDFVVACRVQPEALIAHPYFGSLPIHIFVPPPLSLRRLDTMDVEELVVFCGPATGSERDEKQAGDLQWAAAVRTSRPMDLDALTKQCHHAIVPQDNALRSRPTAVSIADSECLRVPAGRFLFPPRTYAGLRFTDRDGRLKEQGINVGRIDPYRSYVQGATGASAVFTLDHLDEADFVDGQLPLELRLDVFLVRLLDVEYPTAQIELQNPDSGLRSAPIRFEASSFMNQRLQVPRKVIAVDSDGARQVDLLADLVSNGRLEVILTAPEDGVYLGVGRYDLNIRSQAFEYIFLSGREMVVAQSPETLATMLKAATRPVELADRLSQPSGDIVIAVNVRSELQRTAFQRLARAIGDRCGTEFSGESLSEMSASLSVAESAAAQLTARFEGRRDAERAVRQLNDMLVFVMAHALANVGPSLATRDEIDSMLFTAFNGVSMSLQAPHPPSVETRERQLLSVVDAILNNVHVASDDNVLSVEFAQPANLTRSLEDAQYVVANLEEVLAQDLFARERFDLGDEMYERVTDRFPHVPQAWFRRAHELTYNVSAEFDGYENRYAWIRRGIGVLLDGAEQNPDTTDLAWMAARFIALKIGEADERATYRALFSQDKRLHERIAKIVDLDRTRSPDKPVDNWLVARLLFENCVDRQAKSTGSTTIPPLIFFAQPAATQARYARALSEAGHWDEALLAWKEAERMYRELGARSVQLATSGSLRLNDLEPRLAKFGPNDASVKRIEYARKRIQYDYWLTRCEFEQDTEVQAARRLAREAEQHAKQSEPDRAYDSYRQSLQVLSDLRERRPAQVSLFAAEFRHVAKGYREAAEQLGKMGRQSLDSILTMIEESQYLSPFPLLDLQQAGEEDILDQ